MPCVYIHAPLPRRELRAALLPLKAPAVQCDRIGLAGCMIPISRGMQAKFADGRKHACGRSVSWVWFPRQARLSDEAERQVAAERGAT
jgi:hypothetical protein